MSASVQLTKLNFALGGVGCLSGYPLPPLVHMSGRPTNEAIANASYYGNDMRFMIWNGDLD